jgi:hypothetical protein
MSALYLREWSAATQRAQNSTPDLFADRRLKIFGIRRAFIKLGASPTVDLEKLDGHELEQIRVEIAAQLSSRRCGATPLEQQPTDNNEKLNLWLKKKISRS